jgi:predicted Zn-dependent peptidase
MSAKVPPVAAALACVAAAGGAGAGGAAAAAASPRGPQALAGLDAGRTVAWRFTVRSLYEGAAGEPRGARFVHQSGMPVDVLFFPSVPQVSLYARTLPTSDKGEPHTGEHLLLGKGRTGQRLQALLEMRLGESSAETHPDITCYHFRTAAGRAGFLELLDATLTALLRPDFSDEEIRREVAHLEPVAGADGILHLEEKGTVYTEMVATTEKANSVQWRQVKQLVYGQEHPLAREQGGTPEGIRALTPAEVRAFHAANYHVGPNMAMVAVLPLDWSAAEFLAELDALFTRLDPSPAARAYARMPAPHPAATGRVRLGKFSSDDRDLPQSVVLAWKPLDGLLPEERFRIELLLQVLAGGETSLLHRDLVDGKTRKLRTGATGVATYLDEGPLPYPTVIVGGLPAASVSVALLGKLREAVTERVRWLAERPAGDPALRPIAAQARALVIATRRSVLKALDDVPSFGDRSNNGAGWHRYLDDLDGTPGFRKPLMPEASFRRMLADLEGGANPWQAIAARAGLLGSPYASGVRADPAAPGRERRARERRLATRLGESKQRLGTGDAQAALRRLKEESEAAVAAIEARDRQLPRPAFLADPPMTLDDAPFERGTLAGGVPVVRALFPSTVFTDLSVAFDLNGVAPAERALLPMLIAAVDAVGVTTREGEVLDYAATEDRVRATTGGVWARFRTNPTTRRMELGWSAAASSPEEIDAALAWLESFLLRPRLDPSTRERLVDLARAHVQSGRNIFQAPEEGWITSVGAALVYQDRPIYLAVSSPFTSLYLLGRSRWQLEGGDRAARARMEKTLGEVEAAVRASDREAVGKALGGAKDELGEQLRFELGHLPPDTWQGDLRRLVGEIRADLAVPPDETIARLRALLAAILVRAGARVQLTGSPANVARAEAGLGRLLAALPAGARAPVLAAEGRPIEARLRGRYPAARRWVHLALVNDGTTSASHVISAPGPDYRARETAEALDFLAAGVFAGGGPGSFFLRTWGAGLAYGNGLRPSPRDGRTHYYADRCPDPAATMRFVAGLVKDVALDAATLQASLATGFADYRGTDGFSARGAALAADLTDGIDPATVRGWKELLVRTARDPGSLAAIRARVVPVLGRVLVGAGGRVSADAGAVALVIGPQGLLDKYERFLKESGEAEALPRLYPRDFWPPEPAP